MPRHGRMDHLGYGWPGERALAPDRGVERLPFGDRVMAKSRKPRGASKQPAKKPPVLDGLKPEEAQTVLHRLFAAHPGLAAEAERIARSLLAEVSFEAVADEVEEAVCALDPDDLAGRAGRHSWGYVEPDQAAQNLLEEAVDPFLEDLKRHLGRGLEAEALEICKGIVLGLYRVHTRGGELLQYAPEFPEEHAAWVVDLWRAGGDEGKAARRVQPLAGKGPLLPKDFVDQFVPEWTWLLGKKPPRK